MHDKAAAHPLVSYVIPVYNRQSEVKVLLESISKQTYRPIETIVVDDGSTDNSAQVSTATMKRLSMIGDVIRNGVNRGSGVSRDVGLARATGDFVWFLDSDMIVPPAATEICAMTCINEHLEGVMIPERSIGTGLWARCRGLEKRINDFDLPKMSIRFVKRELALAVGGHDTDLAADDYDFQNRVVKLGVRYRLVSETAVMHKEVGSVKAMLRKYYGYGRTMLPYVQRYPEESFRQFFPLRSAYLKAVRLLLEDPTTTVAFFALKTLQFAAGISGAVSTVLGTKKRGRVM